MKILHVTNRLSEGGVETYLLNLLPALVNLNYKVDLFVLDKDEIKLADVFRAKGVNVIVGKYDSIYNIQYIFYFSRLFRQYDLIHTHLFPTQYYAALANIFVGKKIITSEHCTTNKRRRLLFKLLEKIIYSLYDVIVGVSKAASINLINWIPACRNKTITILNGIDLTQFTNAETISRRELKIKNDSLLLAMTARFFEQKDQDTLIRALKILPDNIEVVFIGSGERLQLCQSLAVQLDVANRCHFVGRRNDVASIIKAADICILSTHYEGLPVSVIEYMALGKPIIATDVDGVNEMLDSRFLVKESNADDLASKILLLASNNALREVVAKDNLFRSQCYSLEKMIGSYISIYKELS